MQPSREIGRPMDYDKLLPYDCGFGCSQDDPLAIDLAEPLELMRMLIDHGVAMLNVTCGSPYYNPHIQRPAIFPPIDGYQPPEDPLVGVARQIDTVRRCKEALPDVPMVGTGYSVPAGLFAERRAGDGARRLDRFRRPRADGSVLSRVAGRHARRPAARAKARLSHVQRLHDRAAQRTHLRLLSRSIPYYKALPEREQLLEIKQRWLS